MIIRLILQGLLIFLFHCVGDEKVRHIQISLRLCLANFSFVPLKRNLKCLPSIYKRQFRPAHTMAKKFENAAFFLRLGLPSTLMRQENRAFRERPSHRRNLNTPALCFRVDGQSLKKELYKNDEVAIIMRFSCPSFPQAQIQMTGDCYVFKLHWRSADGRG